MPAQIVFRAGEQSEKVLVSLFNPTAPSRAELRGIYVENNGCVSIPPQAATASVKTTESK